MNPATEVDPSSSEVSAILQGAHLEFFERVWATDPAIYDTRLHAIGFSGLDRVLDAGSGMGQWSASLARLNRQVHSVEHAWDRVRACRLMAEQSAPNTFHVSRHGIEELGLAAESFDAIFCYSVLYFTDYRRSLHEFWRVLKPGGKLYICTNGIGWYWHNLVNAPNRTAAFSPRRMALDTLSRTVSYNLTGNVPAGPGQLAYSKVDILRELAALGFRQTRSAGEGRINLNAGQVAEPRSFFAGRFWGMDSVYEILTWKE